MRWQSCAGQSQPARLPSGALRCIGTPAVPVPLDSCLARKPLAGRLASIVHQRPRLDLPVGSRRTFAACRALSHNAAEAMKRAAALARQMTYRARLLDPMTLPRRRHLSFCLVQLRSRRRQHSSLEGTPQLAAARCPRCCWTAVSLGAMQDRIGDMEVGMQPQQCPLLVIHKPQPQPTDECEGVTRPTARPALGLQTLPCPT